MKSPRRQYKSGGRRYAGYGYVGLMAVVALGGCSSQTSSTTPQHRAESTSTIATRSSSSSSTSTTNAVTGALADAAAACREWVVSQSQISAVSSGTMRNAANQAATAAAADSKWTALQQSMQFLASLPETGNTAGTIAEAQTKQMQIQSLCSRAGVSISS